MHPKQPTDATTKGDRAAQDRARGLIDRVISDRYRIRELIAMGGMGAVYRGEHLLLKKRIAIKILHPETENLPELVKRFEREAIAGAHIQHPNVATATDFGKLSDGSYFLVLEFVKGKTLHQLLQDGPLAPRRAGRLTRQLASALDAIHRLDIVHRDLKPRNIMVVDGRVETVKIIDLGLAKVKVDQLSDRQDDHRASISDDDDQGGLTVAGTIFGTIAYLSPEAAEGMDAVDARSDLYALGLMFYEMLSGKHPFTAVNPVELFMQHRFELPPPIATRVPGIVVPPSLEAIARKLLEKQPANRYQSGQEVAEALDLALKELGPDDESSVGDEEPPMSLNDAGEMSGRFSSSSQSQRPPAVTPSQRPPAVTLASAKETPAPPSVSPASTAPPSVPSAPSKPPQKILTVSLEPEPAPAAPAEPEVAEPAPAPAPARPRKKKLSTATIVLTVVAGLGLGYGVAYGVRVMRSRNTAPVATTTAAPAPTPSAIAASSAKPAAAPSAATAPAALTSAAAEPTAPTAPTAPKLPEAEVASLKLKFTDAFRFRDWKRARKIALDLGKGAPDAFLDHNFSMLVQSLTITLSKENGDSELMLMFGDDLGSNGLDILYAFVEGQGRAPIAMAAAKLLQDEARVKRATPAMRVALELRNASCVDKLALLDRATKEGDARARLALETLGRACFPQNADVDKVINDLRLRFPKR